MMSMNQINKLANKARNMNVVVTIVVIAMSAARRVLDEMTFKVTVSRDLWIKTRQNGDALSINNWMVREDMVYPNIVIKDVWGECNATFLLDTKTVEVRASADGFQQVWSKQVGLDIAAVIDKNKANKCKGCLEVTCHDDCDGGPAGISY